MTERTEKRVQTITKQFEAMIPRNLLDVQSMGLKLKKIGDGVYRQVYKIEGVPLVVKIPGGDAFPVGCRRHARSEYRTVKRIHRYKKFAQLRKYMPRIYYFDNKSGLMLMHYYSVPKKYKIAISNLLSLVVKLIWPNTASSECDVHGANIGMDENNQPVLIDLGYFTNNGGQDDW